MPTVKSNQIKQLAAATVLLVVLPLAAYGADDGYKAPEIEGVNIPWKAIAIVAATFVGIVAATLKNSRRTQRDTAAGP